MAKKRKVRPPRSRQQKPTQDAVKRLEALAKNLGAAQAEAESLAETVRDQLADEASIHAAEPSTTKSKKN